MSISLNNTEKDTAYGMCDKDLFPQEFKEIFAYEESNGMDTISDGVPTEYTSEIASFLDMDDPYVIGWYEDLGFDEENIKNELSHYPWILCPLEVTEGDQLVKICSIFCWISGYTIGSKFSLENNILKCKDGSIINHDYVEFAVRIIPLEDRNTLLVFYQDATEVDGWFFFSNEKLWNLLHNKLSGYSAE